jgi:sarcosine oxidase, subunit gamma
MVELARRAPAVVNVEWLEALPPATRYAFYGDAAARAAALPVWGVPFSEEACRAHADSTRATLWLGPDEYLLLEFGGGLPPGSGLPPGAPEDSLPPAAPGASALHQALGGLPHALVDISHRQFALEVRGPHAATILRGACPLDLDLGEFPIGMCTRTVFAKADIVLWRTRSEAFHVEVWRSFSGYVTGVLQEIAVEFYPSR